MEVEWAMVVESGLLFLPKGVASFALAEDGMTVAFAAAAAPDCAKDRRVDGDILDAVDAVVMAVLTRR